MERDPHYFWAVRIPDDIKQSIYERFNELKNVFAFKRWVHKEDYHITLAFLGAVEASKLNVCIDFVQKGIKNEAIFPLQIQGIQTFGSRKSPRIFWAAVNHEERLHQLQENVYKNCLEAGFTLESRAYQPHLTLARNWVGPDFQHEFLQKYNPFGVEPLSFMVKEVVLYQTHIERSPKYEPIATFSLVGE
ncbi:RNA 2',3'-cyclic phosphodiesterase [Niallia sp. Krafla_26]|uniref:RNA 2',3'-cyclic phosphodiesterase n=1 Tax=Niallia sp. Krafla_26 TaxID=3064703 RepID=UPI003D16B33C